MSVQTADDAGDRALTEATPRRRRALWRPLARLLPAWPHVAAATAATLAALWTFRPWRFGTAIAEPSGDALAFHAWIQNIMESGWYENGTRLNAPFSQNNHSYTMTDELLMGVVGKVLAPLLGVGPAVMWGLVLSFPIAAVAAVVLARSLHLGRPAAAFVGFTFAILPDHMLRGLAGHYSLAQTALVPLGLVAATTVIFRPEGSARRRRVLEGLVLLGCVAVSLGNAYYAVFSGVLVLGAALLALRTSTWRPVLLRLVLRGAALGVPLLVAMALDTHYLPRPLGYPSIDLTRSVGDSDTYAGKILAMLLPAQQHRNLHFRALRALYDRAFPNPAEGPALGLVAALGFVGLVIWAVRVYTRPRSAERSPVLAAVAGLTWVALFTYVVGGIGEAWAFVLNGGGLRVWSRMHLFIALLALLAVGLTIDRFRRARVRVGLVGLLVVIAAWDQTSPFYRPDPGTALAVQSEASALTAQIAAQVPRGAMIYQYPQMTFPEPLRGTGPASAYDGFIPYLYSTGLRWSFGGLQGDPKADWQQALDRQPASEQAVLLRAAGFSGVLVDTAAYTSDPESLATVRAAYGVPALTSNTGRWEFYRLPAPNGVCPAGQAELIAATLDPPLLYPGTGFDPVGNVIVNQKAPTSELRVLTLKPGGWASVHLSMTVDAPASGLTLTWPDGLRQDVAAGTHVENWNGSLTTQQATVLVDRKPGPADRFQVHSFTATVGLGADATQCLAAPSPNSATESGQ